MRGKNNLTSAFISLNVRFLEATGQNVRNGQGHSLCDFCFSFTFFYLPMISRRSSFPLLGFSPSPTPPSLCKGLYTRACWRRLKQRGKKGRLTKEHFISVKFFVRNGGMSGLNPPLCWRAVSGVEVWHNISHWGKENFSQRVAKCLCPVFLF